MKKVFVLVALMLVAAAPAMALSVVNSKHNLSTSGTGTIVSTDYDEVCVFCHTPHAANTAVTDAPLWNRQTLVVDMTPYYNSATIEAATKPTTLGGVADPADSDAGLCMACHDGASLSDPLVNPSNAAGGLDPTMSVGNISGAAMLLDAANGLSNDHPIGMNYTDVYTSEQTSGDNGLFDEASATAAGVKFYSGEMWCSSCHDVHDNQYPPFLLTTNSASKLCVACHNK